MSRKAQAVSIGVGKYIPPHRRNQSGSTFSENELGEVMLAPHNYDRARSSFPAPWKLREPWRGPISQTSPIPGFKPCIEYYAGPAFLASPPASALPIPSWFCKTANEPKAPLDETDLEAAVKEQSPSTHDESLTLPQSQMGADESEKSEDWEGNEMPKWEDEGSVPLPAFSIRSLSECSNSPDTEKGEECEGSWMLASDDEESVTSSLSGCTLVNSAVSSDLEGPHHPRHWTKDSSDDIFPIKPEDFSNSSVSEEDGHLQQVPSEPACPSSPPCTISAQVEAEKEQRKARSLASLKMLQSPARKPEEVGTNHSRAETERLSLGQRALLMENYLRRDIVFQPRGTF